MKKQYLKGLTAFVFAGTLLSSCDLIKDLDYRVDPDPLEMHGDSVSVKITVTVPEKGIHAKASATVTPMLGDKELKPVTYKGEKAAGNGIVIPKAGKTVTYTDKIAYTESFENADLSVKIVASKGKKEKSFEPKKIADATIITPYLLLNDDKPILGTDNFVRITSHTVQAEINYAKNRSSVRGAELKDQDIKDVSTFLGEAVANDRIAIKNAGISSYASVEGEITINENLATERSESAEKALVRLFKTAKFDDGSGEGYVSLTPKGEDWAGFAAAVEATDHEDKNTILRVLKMYPDVKQREKEIRNLAETYEFLKEEVLPSLRRSNLSINYELTGKTDEELTALSKSNPDSLTIEEILFVATLTNDLNEKLRIYKETARVYPNDWRGHNNSGFIQMLQNNVEGASANFEKASSLDENPTVKNNLAIIARQRGDRQKAKALLAEAEGAGPEVQYNLGLIQVQDGNYSDAINNFGEEKTFNVALAQVLSKDFEGGLSTVDASDDKDSAIGFYLKAIIGARTSNNELLINNLKSAIAADPSLKEKASTDREFLKATSEEIKAVIGN